jgi:tetratricopeptide (TPR) repeat protein
MRKLRIALASLMMLMVVGSMTAQQTSIFTDVRRNYKEGLKLFEQGVYSAAKVYFEAAMNAHNQMPQTADFKLIQQEAQLKHAQCALRLNHPDGEKLMRDFVRDNSPSSTANAALVDLGNFYFAQRKWNEAIKYYQEVPTLDLDNRVISEVKFKMGYSYLVKKKYRQAQSLFNEVKDIQGEYYEPANYYYGVTAFQEESYAEAITAFERVKDSNKYSRDVPYYICHIAFVQKDYEKVISYGLTQVNDSKVKKREEINKLVGQSYFEQGDFSKALPYLEEHAKAGNLKKEDLYQLAYAQYRVGKYNDAANNFDELKDLDSKIGQNALYNIGDCYIKTGDKDRARLAFKNASSMSFDKGISEAALFLYGQLSYELNFPSDAANALQSVPETSDRYSEAQELLSKVFLKTRNYEQALEIMDKMPTKSLEVKKAYQKVAYYRGVQLMQEGKAANAKNMFITSLNKAYQYDQQISALANYWIGEINYLNKDYESSINDFKLFLAYAKKNPNEFSDEASVGTANYIIGYNYLKKDDYKKALGFFEEAVNFFAARITRNELTNYDVINKIYPDALLRTGDCHFKGGNYEKALTSYNRVVARKADGSDYAYFQKSIIQGLKNDVAGKLVTLDNIVKQYPNSDFADNAYLEMGTTYLISGELSSAKASLRKLVTEYASSSDLINAAYLKLGLIAYNQDNADEALEYYKKVCVNNPSSVEKETAVRSIEEIYVDLGEPEKYIAFLQTINYNVSNKEKDELTFKAAEAQYENGNYEKAILAYANYIRLFPNGLSILPALYQRAESSYILKKYDDALPDYENIISRGQSTYYGRSLRKAGLISYNVKQDYGKAYNYYSQYLSVATGDDLFEAQLGTVRSAYRLGGKQSEVIRLAEAVKANTAASVENKGEAAYYIAKTALDVNNYGKAKAAFLEVINLLSGEQEIEAYYQIGYITFKEGKADDAMKYLSDRMSEIENSKDWLARTFILMSDIHAQKAEYGEAATYLEIVIENYDGDEAILQLAREKLAKVKAADNKNSLLAPDGSSNSGDLEMEEDGN